ncbi:hypothetical protein A2W14_02840 [Candidatus Gottesmanbacteria bacterium RBG_16_37_8]|uniref:Glycosyltransferase RgtA/B/C/D-like domain-containing protein n=1 Tax=Candidatus Gottesmanbacteria bacterium RBG_16_37_8 TaxID=1798371 RepID=A0A1F5YT68_9BACT|nr:MAG: hypothetical protein A2W14_02840 [Candidatus Gottesmanbacteria bacterium RBG_16_37_8]
MGYFIKKISSIRSNFYVKLGFLIIIIGQLPILLHIYHTPSGYYYPFVDQVSASDYYYIAIVRFGMGADWLLKIPYVTTYHQASIIQFPFIILGKLSLLFGIGPAEMIAIFRVIGGIILTASAVLLLSSILPKKIRKSAFILFLFTEPLPSFTKSIFTDDFLAWVWHFGDAARRISIAPVHYTIGKGLCLLSLFFLFAYMEKKRISLFYFALLIIVVSGIIYPPPNFIIAFSLTLSILIYSALMKFGKKIIVSFIPFIIFILASMLPLIILKMELAKGYPWNMWSKVELGWNDPIIPFEADYFRMFWPLFILLTFSIPIAIKFKKFTFNFFFLFIWAISAYLLFPFANWLSVGKFRFTEGVQIFPLACISAITLSVIGNIVKERWGRKTAFFIGKVCLTGFFAYFLFFTSQVYRDALLRFWPYWINVYFSPRDVESFKFLDSKVPDDAIVLTDDLSANYLPAFARVRTIIGFSDSYEKYPDFKFETKQAVEIIQGIKKSEEAEQYMKLKQIEYVYQNKSLYGQNQIYPELLEAVFDNEKFRIYKVKGI